MLCDTNGYILDFILSTGRDAIDSERFSQLPVSSQIVMRLVETNLNLGHRIVMGSYNSWPQFFLELVKNEDECCQHCSLEPKKSSS